jgi:phosphoribosylanthranilate isomerase
VSHWPDQAIKVCGVRTIEHALVAAQAGATLIGMIFAPGRRQISPALAQSIRAAVHESGAAAKTVGVFVNESASSINAIAAAVALDVVQLSGDETPAIVAQLKLPVFKAIRLTGSPEEQQWQRLAEAQPDRVRLLIDAHVAGSYGGAGVLADWPQAKIWAAATPTLLAGGLNPDNVAAAIEAVAPWGVDVSSGVETDGIKDSAKIIAFIAAAHQALGALHS